MHHCLTNDPQLQAALALLKQVLGPNLLALYLHGSAVTGGLRPQSDIDLLATVEQGLDQQQRKALTAGLLRLSARHPAIAGGPRCLELLVFRQADLGEPDCAPRAELVYGEWLRTDFENGELPMPHTDPEYRLLLAQARLQAVALLVTNAARRLPDTSPEQVRQAMARALPALLQGLHGDERNVLLTLARMWRTAQAGDFLDKTQAASWAIAQLPAQLAGTLEYARRAYLGQLVDDWSDKQAQAGQLARVLRERIGELP
ncbi:aminoglycoside adenylyltransferase domain-containing protein [Pseudomonas sp. CMR5c]|uniref:aminoglycoside adenylyltransferase domain-containing protein n=1 Tax=Pseudomonas sp. CMR5c TaxID=658630 RepID=UPI00069FCF66|nr:aminoglycoside adenylyltransferase domain-containing protein [Pseudomonas sp. CMR5c]AZC20249.1 Spectinomycin 9-O-adenylyltransferase [Pseudomonas sp. CMR5c]